MRNTTASGKIDLPAGCRVKVGEDHTVEAGKVFCSTVHEISAVGSSSIVPWSPMCGRLSDVSAVRPWIRDAMAVPSFFSEDNHDTCDRPHLERSRTCRAAQTCGTFDNEVRAVDKTALPCTLYPPYTLHPVPYARHPTPDILHPTPDTRHPTPDTLHLTFSSLHPTPYTLYSTLHHAPDTRHPTPYPRHP
eukprot:3081692-Rhodomonas_salina.1